MLSQFLLQTSAAEAMEIAWLRPIPAWVWLLVIVPAVVAFALYIYRRERPATNDGATAGGGRKAVLAVLTALRVLAILAVIALLAQPVLRRIKYTDLDPGIIVLADDSLSMDIADKYSNRELLQKLADAFRTSGETIESTTRYDLLRRLFRDPEAGILEALRSRGRIAAYTFGAGVKRIAEIPRHKPGAAPLTDAELELLPDHELARGEERVRESRIADALLDAVASERARTRADAVADQRFAAIFLFSDGQQTPGARSLADVGRRLAQQHIPVFAVGVGNPDEPKDIRVAAIEVSEVVLAGDLVPVDASVIAEGFQGEAIRVELKLDGAVLARRDIVLEGDGHRQTVRLEFRPPRPGEFSLVVEVESRPGELFVENNVAQKPLRVLDQKIRVLYADGLPRYEYRYLRSALTRDTTMQTQVYLFSADSSFIHESSPGLPPLRELPRTREELFAYHVVILGDVDATRLGSDRIALLKEFVYEAGGGVIFIAGETANPWSYLHTELYSIIPVEVRERANIAGGDGFAPKSEPFNVVLTPAGQEHTLMRLDNDRERNFKLWENQDGRIYDHLPQFLSFQEIGRAKKGTVVLARHPTRIDTVEQKGLPIFTTLNYGKGRTFFSAVDDTWRWRRGVDNLYFYRFWGQVIRYCATGRLLGKTPRFAISTDKSSYSVGESVQVECRVFDANLRPATDKTLTIYHQTKLGDNAPEALTLELDPIQGQGAYRGSLVANRLGLHDLWIGTEAERLAFRTFEVTVPALELKDPRRNTALMEEIARLSGGRYLEIQDIRATVDTLEADTRARLGDVTDDPLWDDWWLIIAFTVLIGLEWILRKLVNLL